MKQLKRSRILRAFLTVLCVFAPVSAFATPGWSTSSTIASILPTEAGLTFILNGFDNRHGCTSASWVQINLSDPNYALISSTALTAFSQGKPIMVWTDGCDAGGSSHFIAIWMNK